MYEDELDRMLDKIFNSLDISLLLVNKNLKVIKSSNKFSMVYGYYNIKGENFLEVLGIKEAEIKTKLTMLDPERKKEIYLYGIEVKDLNDCVIKVDFKIKLLNKTGELLINILDKK